MGWLKDLLVGSDAKRGPRREALPVVAVVAGFTSPPCVTGSETYVVLASDTPPEGRRGFALMIRTRAEAGESAQAAAESVARQLGRYTRIVVLSGAGEIGPSQLKMLASMPAGAAQVESQGIAVYEKGNKEQEQLAIDAVLAACRT